MGMGMGYGYGLLGGEYGKAGNNQCLECGCFGALVLWWCFEPSAVYS